MISYHHNEDNNNDNNDENNNNDSNDDLKVFLRCGLIASVASHRASSSSPISG